MPVRKTGTTPKRSTYIRLLCASVAFVVGSLAIAPAAAIASAAPSAPGAESGDDGDSRLANAWRVSPAPDEEGAFRNYFILEAEPGSSVSDIMVVENLSAEPKTLEVYGQEALLTADGKYSARPGRPEPGTFGTWIAPSQSSVTVPPYGKVEVAFTVSVPVGAAPGDYGGAVFTSLSAPADQDGQQVVVNYRVGVRLHLRVPGEVKPSIAITDLKAVRLAPWWNPFPAEVGLSFTVTNTGNVRLSGKVVSEAVVSYLWRTERRSGLDTVETPELLPGASVVFSAEPVTAGEGWARAPYFTGFWDFGKHTYTVRVVNTKIPYSDELVPASVVTIVVWRVPWLLIGIIAAVLGLVGWWVYRRFLAKPIAGLIAGLKARRRVAVAPQEEPQ